MPCLRTVILAGCIVTSPATIAATPSTEPINLVVAMSPGSGTDTASRLLAEELSKSIGRPIIVENKPGAMGTIGASAVAKSKPDGLTLLMIGGTAITAAPHLLPNMALDPQKDLAPIYRVAGSSLVLYVGEQYKDKFRSAQEFVSTVKAEPGKYSYAGSHAMNMVAMESFKKELDLKMEYIPYKGGPQALTDLAGGNVMAMFNDVAGSSAMAAAGKIKGLAIMRKDRVADFPDLPTVYELGYRGPEIVLWTGLFAPAGTNAEWLDYLSKEIAKIAERPDFKERMKKLGLELNQNDTPQAFAQFIREESDALSPFIKASVQK